MSKYPRIQLAGTQADVKTDIEALRNHFGPDSYFVIAQEPAKKILEPAEFDSEGNEIKAAVYSQEYFSNVILPQEHNFDITTLKTAK